jgi:DNA (cytosine-5)-methyltransferase 1
VAAAAEKTLRRIALGIKRYVLDNPRPFIVDMQRENRPRGTDEPLGTVTTQGNRFNLVTPTVIRTDMHRSNAGCAFDPRAPLNTMSAGGFGVVSPVVVPVTRASGGPTVRMSRCRPSPGPTAGSLACVAPVLAHLAHGEGKDGRWGRGASDINAPVGTIHAGGKNFAVVAPTLVQTGYGERDGQAPRALDIETPLGTVVAGGQKHAVVAAFLAKHYGGQVGRKVDAPAPTTTTRGTQTQLVAANLVHLNRGDKTATGCDEPNRTVTAGG